MNIDFNRLHKIKEQKVTEKRAREERERVALEACVETLWSELLPRVEESFELWLELFVRGEIPDLRLGDPLIYQELPVTGDNFTTKVEHGYYYEDLLTNMRFRFTPPEVDNDDFHLPLREKMCDFIRQLKEPVKRSLDIELCIDSTSVCHPMGEGCSLSVFFNLKDNVDI